MPISSLHLYVPIDIDCAYQHWSQKEAHVPLEFIGAKVYNRDRFSDICGKMYRLLLRGTKHVKHMGGRFCTPVIVPRNVYEAYGVTEILHGKFVAC